MAGSHNNATQSVPARYESELRAAQLNETVKLALYPAISHVMTAAAFVPFFWATPQRAYVLVLFFLVSVPALCVIFCERCLAHKIATPRAVDVGHKLAALLAFLVGGAWGTMPVALFAASNPDHRMIVVGTIVGVIAGTFVQGPIFSVCLFFVLPAMLGGFLGLAINGHAVAITLSILLMVYGGFVVFSVLRLNELSIQRILDRMRVSEQNDTIGLLLRDFEEGSADWLWEIDAKGRLRHASERVAAAANRSLDDLRNAPFETLFLERKSGAKLSDSAKAVFAAITARRSFHDQIIEIETAGSPIWWKLTGKPMFDASRAFVGYRGVGADVTAQRTSEAQIAYMANYDDLTGLANRGSFLARAEIECQAAATDRTPRALFYLDLDGFKGINDNLGHAAGDEVLRQVAARLKAMAPPSAVLARLGGDEFAVLSRPLKAADNERLAGEIIKALSAPYYLPEGSRAEIGVSIGIATAPNDALQIDSLMMKADLALYRAKAEGRGCCRRFVEDYEVSLLERRMFERDLRLALARREFEVRYQPLVDLSSGKVVCFEALLRWTSPSQGIVSPATFIPVAEATGLIVDIGRWVLLQACMEAKRWPESIRIAVNISPLHFKAPTFIDDVLVALEMSRLDPCRLEIEITEGVFLDNSSDAIENLDALRRRGIRIALDDFGTGYSSLNYLVTFPVDKIKIDRSFITNFVERDTNRAIVESILMLANKLSISVTAEGVETSEQACALKLRRCDDIQGYLISAAVTKTEVAELIATIPLRFATLVPTRPAPVALVSDNSRLESRRS